MWLWIALGIVVSIGFVAFLGAPYVPSKRKDIDRDIHRSYTSLIIATYWLILAQGMG